MSDNERDELAGIIAGVDEVNNWDSSPDMYQKYADAILAAGYRRPRTIMTVEELDALRVGAIVAALDTAHVALKVWQSKHPRKDGTPLSDWKVTGDDSERGTYELALPATVLYEPEPQP